MIIYGKNPIFEALKLELVKELYIRKGTALYDISFPVPVKVLAKPEFDSRFHRDAQGLAAEVKDIEAVSFEDILPELKTAQGVMVLDRIQDPHNFGAIVRSAHVFGVNHFIVPRYHQASLTATVAKASAGALFYCKVAEHTNLRDALIRLKSLGFQVVAADMDGKTSLAEASFNDKVALVVGGEGKGIRPSLAEEADLITNIPMKGRIDSLNAAQSAAIVLYEIFGKKIKKTLV